MTRAITVHFGLHKTGTSTAEATLRDAAAIAPLADRVIVVGRKDWPEVSTAAKRYSTTLTVQDLATFSAAFAARLDALPGDGARGLLIANVDLGGCLPSLASTHGYAAVPALVGAMSQAIAARPAFGPATFVGTTRAPEAWLRSLYWQTLKVSRETRDFDEFAAASAPLADHTALFARVADVLAEAGAGARLCTARLEDSAHSPAGPATPLLEAAGFSRDEIARLRPHKRLKRAPGEEVHAALLALNRSALSDADLDAAKSVLASIAQAGG